MTPLPHFEVMTPLGLAVCIGVIADDDYPEWATWVISTGEAWFWRNRHIRMGRNATNGFVSSSPFCGLNPATLRHIKRYKTAGFLPADYDPGKVETWP